MSEQQTTQNSDVYIAPWSRIIIMLFSVLIVLGISHDITGEFIPSRAQDSLIFENALLLIVFGSAIAEHKFTKPADSLLNSLVGGITLLSVYYFTDHLLWWLVSVYCIFVFTISVTNVAVTSGKRMSPAAKRISALTYYPAVLLGRAKLLYSIIFIFGIFSFYIDQTNQVAKLIMFWGFFIVIWPLGLPEFISKITLGKKRPNAIGELIRTEWPNIARFSIDRNTVWTSDKPKLIEQADGSRSLVFPLYKQLQGNVLVGTGLISAALPITGADLQENRIYEFSELGRSVDVISREALIEALGGGKDSKMVGFIVEGSTINEIRFENWDEKACREGMVVWAKVQGARVYYQLVGGTTLEEAFNSHRQGFHVANAVQLGVLDTDRGFEKHLWLPRMNTPVFADILDAKKKKISIGSKGFNFGRIPGTNIEVNGDFSGNMEFHTALLGITGSGKTELAFDLIRDAVANGIKVISLDITGKYKGSLVDLTPRELSLSAELLEELESKVFEVETGEYGAGPQKAALRKFLLKRKGAFEQLVQEFLVSNDKSDKVGLINLSEISNTMASLYSTELYLDSIFKYAKGDPDGCPRVLIVLEESQTIVPEPSGLDFGLRTVVGKISQIALQGRKYGIGLLVIAQRTATVSKSVLTQCNTVISFGCYDNTSLNYLNDVFGSHYAQIVPDLPFLHAVMSGKGIPSSRPLVVEIPFLDEKRNK